MAGGGAVGFCQRIYPVLSLKMGLWLVKSPGKVREFFPDHW